MLTLRTLHKMCLLIIAALFLHTTPSGSNTVFAQTTSFTYQGKLTDSGALINALYDFVLTLWDAPTNGNQLGNGLSIQNVPVVDGIFTLTIDFGAGAFNGANRFLEISVKPSSNTLGLPTLLSPRQQILSTPYAVKSVSATTADGLSVNCVNCVTSSQIQSVSASQISSGTLASARGGTGLGSTGAAGNYLRSDGANWAISPLLASDVSGTIAVSKGGTGLSVSGVSGNFLRSDGTNWTSSALQASDLPDLGNSYIRNGSPLQSGADFNISGNGTAGGTLGANVVNATTQYNIAGARILSKPGTGNLFVGANAG